MTHTKKGKLILTSLPTRTSREKVVEYLSARMKKVSQEKINTLLDETPVVLSSNIQADKGLALAKQLQQLGAIAVFQEEGNSQEVQQPIRNGQTSNITEDSISEPPKKQWGVRDMFITVFFIFAIAGAWAYNSLNQPSGDNGQIKQNKQIAENKNFPVNPPANTEKKQEEGNASFLKLRPLTVASPVVTAVKPQDMLEAYFYQYRFRPDNRLLETYKILLKRYRALHADDSDDYRIGEIKSDGKHVFVPLLKNGTNLKEIVLTLPLQFAEVKHSLGVILHLLDGQKKGNPASTTTADQSEIRRFHEASTSINTVDPRYIVTALSIFEELWHSGYDRAELLKGAARGYAMLLLTADTQRSNYGDRFAAEALAFLVMAENIGNGIQTESVELLIAMCMGYRSHADTVVSHLNRDSKVPEDRIISAYMRQDLEKLKQLADGYEGVLAKYLLARHYREIGLYWEAEIAAEELLKTFPGLYPSIIENINAGPLNLAKVLTLIYPIDIISNVEQSVASNPLEAIQSWQEKIDAYKGDSPASEISFTRFDELLDRWEPYPNPDDFQFIIDSERLKDIYRLQYSNAIYSRFDILFRRWAVIEQAATFVESFAAKDTNHPLVQLMLGKVYSKSGNHSKAYLSLRSAIMSPKSTGKIVQDALFTLGNHEQRLSLLQVAVDRIDGRPKNRLLMGYILQAGSDNFDLAADYYESGLSQDPYQFWVYYNLALVKGSDQPFQQALQKSQGSYQLLEEAAKYYAVRADRKSLEQAVLMYELTLELVPSKVSIVQNYAQVLAKLKRFEQALSVLNTWLEQYGGNGLDTVSIKSQRAHIYLEIGKPDIALQSLGNDIDSYKAGVILNVARAYEELGSLDKAESYYQKGFNRYPTVKKIISETAGHYWRQNKYEQAAKVIAHGRPIYGEQSHRWYLESFCSAFQEVEEEKILEAIGALSKTGATSWELHALAWCLADINRYAIAFSVLSGIRAPGMMENLELIGSAYKLLLEWRDQEKASTYLKEQITMQQRGPMLSVLYKAGLYKAVLAEVGAPDAYPEYREFIWLQLLITWLYQDKEPEEFEEMILTHYMKESSNNYNAIGQYLLGSISLDNLFKRVSTSKQRCEFAYYIGLKERLAGNFVAAAHWYQICRQTLLYNNGEFHWASNELFYWSAMGLGNRHRLVTNDIATFRQNQARKIKSVEIPSEKKASGQKETIRI